MRAATLSRHGAACTLISKPHGDRAVPGHHAYTYLRVRPFSFTQQSLAAWPVPPRYAKWRAADCALCGGRVLLWRGARIIFPPVARRGQSSAA